MKYLIFAIIGMMVLAGCEMLQGSCITVGGSKDDMAGEIKYCFDKAGSEVSGIPTFEKEDENGDDSGKIFGFDLDQIKSIWNKIRGKEEKEEPGEPIKAATTTVDLKGPEVVRELVNFIKK